MDDSALYTGVDGLFGNEQPDEEVKRISEEQDRLIRELTPQLNELIALIDSEKASHLSFIEQYVDKSTATDELFRAEMKASAMYRTYLDTLKNKFTLALNEIKK